jgi:murein tripeptide amidase MpaA
MSILVNTKFDGGSIEVIDVANHKNLQFKIRKDTNSEFAQWFYFQLNNVLEKDLNINIGDLSKTAYPEGWKNYSICVSYDNQYWFRVKTKIVADKLIFNFKPEFNSIFIAYFEPYSLIRHQNLIAEVNASGLALHEIIGFTNENRSIDLLTFGDIDDKSKQKIWFTARQHPGETMAQWFMEGIIHRLMEDADPVTKNLLKNYVFLLIPNMNPDGSFNGNLRTNSLGVNLNREWLNPSIKKSPEVYYTVKKMKELGVDMFFDIHGDESIPYIFTAGCEENPSFSKKQAKLAKLFQDSLLKVSPDYQIKHGYVRGHFNAELASIATSMVGDNFDCLSFTLEMPFKDNDNNPDDEHGWDGKRSHIFGQSFLTAINLLTEFTKE